MILTNAASRYTRVPTGQTTASIAGASTIRVHGAIISSTSNVGTCTFFEADGTTVIVSFTIQGGITFELKTGFIADKGLQVTTDANVSCTVFHSQVN